jgi:acyl-CoA thioesterase-1
MTAVAVLGDSLAVSPTRELSFPSVLQERVRREGFDASLANFGVRGDTTSGGLRRLDQVLRTRPQILILALGANDGLRGEAISTIRHNLAVIIQRAQIEGVRTLLCGMETPPLRGWGYTREFHDIFPELARNYSVPLVPFLLVGVALHPDFNGADLIHPNAAGARKIAETVWPFLRPLIAGGSHAAVG